MRWVGRQEYRSFINAASFKDRGALNNLMLLKPLVKVKGVSEVAEAIGKFGGNILDVSHQQMFASVPIKKACLYLTGQTKDAKQNEEILARLKELGNDVELLAE